MNTPRNPSNTRGERRGYGRPGAPLTPAQQDEHADDMAERRRKSAMCKRCGLVTGVRARMGWCPVTPGA